MKRIPVMQPVMVSNQERARVNRAFFKRHARLVVNMIGAPGAGKTTVIGQLIRTLGSRTKTLVIEGDIRGSMDSARLRKLGVATIQINTATECHLDAFMIAQTLPRIRKRYDLVVIENVGNLVCPAEFDVGEDFKIALLSVTGGDDKPFKYPLLFHLARAVVINKTDLAPYVDFDMGRARRRIRNENPRAAVFTVSAKHGTGFAPFAAFLVREMGRARRH